MPENDPVTHPNDAPKRAIAAAALIGETAFSEFLVPAMAPVPRLVPAIECSRGKEVLRRGIGPLFSLAKGFSHETVWVGSLTAARSEQRQPVK